MHEVAIDINSGGTGMVVYRNRISHMATAIQPNTRGVVEITENYITDLSTFGTDAHLNGICFNGGNVTASLVLRNYLVFNKTDGAGRDVNQTDCLAYMGDYGGYPSTGTNRDGSVGYINDSNYISGTGYSIYGYGDYDATHKNLIFTDNLLSTISGWPDSGYFGAIAFEAPWGSFGCVATNNRWADGANAGELVFGSAS